RLAPFFAVVSPRNGGTVIHRHAALSTSFTVRSGRLSCTCAPATRESTRACPSKSCPEILPDVSPEMTRPLPSHPLKSHARRFRGCPPCALPSDGPRPPSSIASGESTRPTLAVCCQLSRARARALLE